MQVAEWGTGFTQIPNETREDPRLSLKAKGLILYLLGLPPGWRIHVNELVKHSTSGRRVHYNAIKELIRNKYITREVVRSASGFAGVKYTVWPYRGGIRPVSLKGVCTFGTTSNTYTNIGRSRGQARAQDLGLEKKLGTSIEKLRDKFASWTIKKRLNVGNKGATTIGWTRRTLKRWLRPIEDLLDTGVSLKEMERVMQWYMEHYGDEYVPEAQTMNSFCQKFNKIRSQMMRSRNGEDEDDDDTVGSKAKIRYTLER